MLQDCVQVDLLGAGVRKRCAPPFVHVPPPRPVVPRTWEHTGSLRLIFAPPLRSRAAPCAWVAPRPVRTPFAPSPFASQVAPHIVPCPSPRAWTPCVRPPPGAWPPRARTPCVRSPPGAWPLRARTPCVRPPPGAWPLRARAPCVRSPLARGPFARGPLACGPPLTHDPLCVSLPLLAPLSLLRFRYAR